MKKTERVYWLVFTRVRQLNVQEHPQIYQTIVKVDAAIRGKADLKKLEEMMDTQMGGYNLILGYKEISE